MSGFNDFESAFPQFPRGNSLPGFPSGFQNSPFGQFWDVAIYNKKQIENKTKEIIYLILVSEDAAYVKDKFANQVVDDNVIKLYVVVHDETLIDYTQTNDLRTANLRYSNIIEIVGVVLGDTIYENIKDYPEKQADHVYRFVNAFYEIESQKAVLFKTIDKTFSIYMHNHRDSFFKLGLVGKLLQDELDKSLQEFWKPVLTSLAGQIRTYKLEDEKYWQPYLPDGEIKEDKAFTPLVGEKISDIQTLAQSFFKNFNTIDLLVKDYLNLNEIEDSKHLKEETKGLLKQALTYIYGLFKEILDFFKDGITNFIEEIADRFYELNAFLVGLYNGAIEFVAGLIELLGFMSGLLSGDSEQLWEAVKTRFKEIKEQGFIKSLFESLSKFFDGVKYRYDTEQTKYLILKNLGEDLFSIIDVVLIALAAYEGGKVILKSAKEAYDAFKKKVDDIFKKTKKEFDDIEDISKLKRAMQIKQLWDNFSYEDLLEALPSKKPCFLAGTLVKTENGLVAIEDIVTGQQVYAYNFKNRKAELKTVTQIYKNIAEKYICINTQNGMMKATGQHRFWIPVENKWIMANSLQKGMNFLNLEGKKVTIISLEIQEAEVKTYNLEVEEHHNYYVGQDEILTHNKTRASIFTSTDLIEVEFYFFEDLNRNPLYVGQTTQGVLVRAGQHEYQYKKNTAKKLWFKEVEGVLRLRINGVAGPFTMTPYEAAVTEFYEINIKGGVRKGNKGLYNKKKPIGKKKFDDIKKLGTFNPCKFYV